MKVIKKFLCLTLYIAITFAQNDVTEVPDNDNVLVDTVQLDHCSVQANPPLQCIACEEGQSLKKDKKGCIDCPKGCSSCYEAADDQILCSACVTEPRVYIKGSDNLCKACPTGCEKCQLQTDDETICSKCQQGYFLKYDGSNSCGACASGCLKCTDNGSGKGSCQEAAPGYYLPSDLTKPCPACDEGCAICSGERECSKCEDGYALEEGECQACPWGCHQCNSKDESGARVCDECMDGYGVKTFASCDACGESNCINCNLDGECTECQQGFILNSEKHTCIVCPDHCTECEYNSEEDNAWCKNGACEAHFIKNLHTGECEECDPQCESDACSWQETYSIHNQGPLETVNAPVCTRCNINYGLTMDGKCKECPEGCIACHSCYLDHDVSGASDCFTCVGAGIDEAYEDEGTSSGCIFYDWNCPLDDDFITPDFCLSLGIDPRTHFAEGGSSARMSYYYHPVATSGNSISMSCCKPGYGDVTDTPTGFTYSISNCEKCVDPYCLTCDNDNTICTECINGYGFDENGACAKCAVENCMSCSAGIDSCTTCQYVAQREDHIVSIYSFSDYMCAPCPDHCEYHFARDNTCHSWTDTDGQFYPICPQRSTSVGYTALYPGDTVKKCRSHCDKCYVTLNIDGSERSEYCVDCSSGYAVDEHGACKECPSHCSSCDWDSGNARVNCLVGHCDAAFVLDEFTGKCVPCGEGCTDCEFDLNGPPKCSSCASRHALDADNKKCIKCPNHCKVCTFDKESHITKCSSSESCDVGFGVKSDGQCYACPLNCRHCEPNEANVLECSVCKEAHFRNTMSCGLCPVGCKTCVEKSGRMACSACHVGFVYNPELQICSKCPSNCRTCFLDAGSPSCKYCNEGYVLLNGVCTACSDLAGDHCLSCTIPGKSGSSSCKKCEDGFVLNSLGVCTACEESLDQCAVCEDKDAACMECDQGYDLDQGQCGFNCYICDGMDDCSDINNGTNAMTEFCYAGACKVIRVEDSESKSVRYERGCMMTLCENEKELCTTKTKPGSNHTITTCEQCCTSDRCNNMILTGAASVLSSALLTILILLGLQSIINV